MSDGNDTSENLRSEYSALMSYFGTVASLRFTLIGFFLPAVGLVLSQNVAHPGPVLMGLSACVWLVELRNRVTIRQLLERGNEIEQTWKELSAAPFAKPLCETLLRERDVPFMGLFRTLHAGRGLGRIASYSLGIDLLLLLSFLYGTWLLVAKLVWPR